MQMGIACTYAHKLVLSKPLIDHNLSLLRSGSCRILSMPLQSSAQRVFCRCLACHFDCKFQLHVCPSIMKKMSEKFLDDWSSPKIACTKNF